MLFFSNGYSQHYFVELCKGTQIYLANPISEGPLELMFDDQLSEMFIADGEVILEDFSSPVCLRRALCLFLCILQTQAIIFLPGYVAGLTVFLICLERLLQACR